MHQIRNYVSGLFVDGVSTFDGANSADSSIVGAIDKAEARLVDAAVNEA